jgi:peptidoglycan hydrolase-like protein with peptidoglycan-binding domain
MSSTRFAHRARGILTITTALIAAALALPAAGAAQADTAGGAAARLASMPTLARGAGYAFVSGSPQVRRLQRWLRRQGARPGPVDGLFGPLTEGAVVRFQRAQGIAPDGIAGPITLRHLAARLASRHGGQAARTAAPRRSASPATPAAKSGTPAAKPAASPASRPVHAAPTQTARPRSDKTPFVLILALAIALSLAAAALLHRRRGRVRRGHPLPAAKRAPAAAAAPRPGAYRPDALPAANGGPATAGAAYAGVYRAVPVSPIDEVPQGDGAAPAAMTAAEPERHVLPAVNDAPADARELASATTFARGAESRMVDDSGDASVVGVIDAPADAVVVADGGAPADAERPAVVATAAAGMLPPPPEGDDGRLMASLPDGDRGAAALTPPLEGDGAALPASQFTPGQESSEAAGTRVAVLVIDARPPEGDGVNVHPFAAFDGLGDDGADPRPPTALDGLDANGDRAGAPPPGRLVTGGVRFAAQKSRRPKQGRVRSHVGRS